MNIEKIANELARLMKGANDFDAGDFAHFFPDDVYDNCGPIWNAVCDRAEELLPTISLTDQDRASWAEADRAFAAEQRAEKIAFGHH